jgi:hypothetical protein
MEIRPFKPEDAEAVSRLFSRHTSYRRDAAFWLWFNRILPVRPSIVAVAEDAGEVVGHYAILPVELRLPDGKLTTAGHGVHAFVGPSHRDRVGIFQISALAYRLAREAGLSAVFGFPNERYRLVQEKIERWRAVSVFNAWTKPGAQCAEKAEGRLEPAELDDNAQMHQAIRLWEHLDATRDGQVAIAQTARWWMHRYLLHPQKPYALFWYARDGDRRGLVVAKYFQAEAESRAHVVDYALLRADDAPDMLRAFGARWRGKADRFVHWPTNPVFEHALRSEGYRPDGFSTFFGMRRLQSAGGAPDAFDSLATDGLWRLPLGLSDAF